MRANTIAEFYVESDHVRVDLEIGGADLAAFENLLPDGIYEEMGNEPRPLRERLGDFFERDLRIGKQDGTALVGAVIEMGPRPRIKRDVVTGEPLPADPGEEPELTVFARLVYEFDGQPSVLTFSAPPGAGVGFVVYHGGVAVNDFRYLGREAVLNLDWSDPFYTQFDTRGMRRRYFASMSGFIYVEPYEVRKEIIVRPLDLQRWLPLGLNGRDTIPVDLQREIERKVAAFLREHQPVEIDGVRVEPELARINFLERTLRTSRVIEPREELNVYSAVLGAIFVYPTDGLPQRVTMEWDLWNDRLERVPASAVDQAGGLPTYLERDWRVLEWQNFLKNPELPTLVEVLPPPNALERASVWLAWLFLALTLGSVVWVRRAPRLRAAAALALVVLTASTFWVARAATVDDTRGQTLVAALLHNVYRAFDFRDEGQIYDVLEKSADGDLLERLYLEVRRGLVLANQGGARAKVNEIEVTEFSGERADGGAFRAEVAWNVAGSVGHWGHVHERRNRIRAALEVAPVDGVWKIVDLEVLAEERL